jgi:RNA polymerase sigma-70 factor (ECF subfamily)
MRIALARKAGELPRVVDINGMPALLTVAAGATTVISFTVDDGRIVEIDMIRNPEKLRGVVA